MRRLALLAVPLCLCGAASGPDLVGLFRDACLAHAQDPASLRAWVAQHTLPAVPAQTLRRPGAAFDAGAGRLLAVFPGGGCVAAARTGDIAALPAEVAAALVQAGLAPRLTEDAPDPRAAVDARHRRWVMARAGRLLAVVLTTERRDGGTQASIWLDPLE